MRCFRNLAWSSRRRTLVAGRNRLQVEQLWRQARRVAAGRVRIHTIALLLSLVLLPPAIPAACAGSQRTLQDAPAAPPLEESESFMGVPIGTFVRVKCTAPEIELNNARLLAVTKTTITVASVNGERFNLPKATTLVSDPVNWQRTAGITGQAPPPPRRRKARWLLPVALLVI